MIYLSLILFVSLSILTWRLVAASRLVGKLTYEIGQWRINYAKLLQQITNLNILDDEYQKKLDDLSRGNRQFIELPKKPAAIDFKISDKPTTPLLKIKR